MPPGPPGGSGFNGPSRAGPAGRPWPSPGRAPRRDAVTGPCRRRRRLGYPMIRDHVTVTSDDESDGPSEDSDAMPPGPGLLGRAAGPPGGRLVTGGGP